MQMGRVLFKVFFFNKLFIFEIFEITFNYIIHLCANSFKLIFTHVTELVGDNDETLNDTINVMKDGTKIVTGERTPEEGISNLSTFIKHNVPNDVKDELDLEDFAIALENASEKGALTAVSENGVFGGYKNN